MWLHGSEQEDMKRRISLWDIPLYVIVAVSFLYVIICAAGCGRGNDDSTTAADSHTASQQLPDTTNTVHIAVTGVYPPRATYRKYAALVQYIGEKLGRPTKLVQRRSYVDINRLFTEGKVKIAFLSAGAFANLDETCEFVLLAVSEREAGAQDRSVVVVHTDSPINRFDQLKGKPFSFVDTLSLSGYATTACLLAKRGIDPYDFFSAVLISGSHDNSISLVRQRRVAGACISSLVLNGAEGEKKMPDIDLQTIHTSAELPPGPVIVCRGISASLCDSIRQELMSMADSEHGREILSTLGIRRFTSGSKAVYRRAKEIIDCSLKKTRSSK